MIELLIGTGNTGKLKEIIAVLQGLPYQFRSLEERQISSSPRENDSDYIQSAYIKASYYARKSGLMTLAEDSGISIDALPGELGVTTRRWGAGESASDSEWIVYFLDALKDVPDAKRGARFVCHACLVDAQGEVLYESVGETAGYITRELRAPILPGLPISSCFLPDTSSKVYAALTAEEKAILSHRGKAIQKIRTFLETHTSKQNITFLNK